MPAIVQSNTSIPIPFSLSLFDEKCSTYKTIKTAEITCLYSTLDTFSLLTQYGYLTALYGW